MVCRRSRRRAPDGLDRNDARHTGYDIAHLWLGQRRNTRVRRYSSAFVELYYRIEFKPEILETSRVANGSVIA